MVSALRRQVKVACLACRASKTRCDGKDPCASCYSSGLECQYLPSRRGGARRGVRYQNSKKRANAISPQIPSLELSDSIQSTGISLENIDGLALPYNEMPIGVCESPSEAFRTGFTDRNRTAANNPARLDACILRTYNCEADLINAYYIFIHPFFPLLPPPTVCQYEDRSDGVSISLATTQADKSLLSFWPTSPFSLALLSLIVLIPSPEDPHPMVEEAVAFRRSYAELYAQSALETIENCIDSLGPSPNNRQQNCNESGGTAADPSSFLHPEVPSQLEPILALLLLSMYECCQRDNWPKMRIRANNALTAAMDLSLHSISTEATQTLHAHRRTWWITVFLVYQSSIMNGLSPIILANDARITTPYPNFHGSRELWPLIVKAQTLLLESCHAGRELTSNDSDNNDVAGACDNAMSSSFLLHDRIRELDSRASALGCEFDRSRCATDQKRAEAFAAGNMWDIGRTMIHTSQIKLHRYRAFLDYPIFLGEHCDLASINNIGFARSSRRFVPGRVLGFYSAFPFTQKESAKRCLKSALAVSRLSRYLSSPSPYYSDTGPEALASFHRPKPSIPRHPGWPQSLPYMTCCKMQSFYALTMLLRDIRASSSAGDFSSCYHLLSDPQPESEVQDVERLIEELRHATESLVASIQSDTVFEGVVGMACEVESVHDVTFSC